METDVLVLGGGPGGYAAAFRAADLGREVTIVEKQGRLGGVCLQRGCIPSKALLHVARVIAEVGEMGEWGIGFGEPRIEVDGVRSRKQKVVDTLTKGLAQVAKRRKVRVVESCGAFLDSTHVKLDPAVDGDDTIAFEHCILATGSRPAIPPNFPMDSERIMTSTEALDLPDVPERLLVVGGGYIGLELGTVYASLGAEVTVVEMLSGLLPGADRDLVKPLRRRLDKAFAEILLQTKVASMQESEDRIEVAFEGQAKEGTDRFDRVLVSVGRRPNTEDLGLENTGVKVDDRGFVAVNEKRCTADERIYAVGDVTGDPMLAHKAFHEGKVAAEAIVGEPAVFEPRGIPAVVFTDPEIAWVGLTEEQAKQQDVHHEAATFPWAASGRATSFGRTEGLTKVLVDPDSDVLLGVGMTGVGAGEMISEAALALEMGCEVRDVAETIHPHPTLSETVMSAAEVYMGMATEIYKPRKF